MKEELCRQRGSWNGKYKSSRRLSWHSGSQDSASAAGSTGSIPGQEIKKLRLHKPQGLKQTSKQKTKGPGLKDDHEVRMEGR